MAFGSLSSAHQIMVLLSLKGGPAYDAQMEAAAASTSTFNKALLTTAANMNVATKRSWLHNQALFTARRYAFYATLAVSALAYEVVKLGFSYDSTVQSARVALQGMFHTRQETDRMIKSLYNLSTFSPFLFKDTLTAFRTMAPALKNAGIAPSLTMKTLKAVMDALSQSGRTTTGNLTRIGVQLQHLANIGRPTGQVLLALARDGLPVYPALRKELGLTGTSLENVASSGLSAKDVIVALNKFIETSPIYRGQAFKQATMTLQGNWQMFKDILSQAAGTSQRGMFSGLTARLREINLYLKPLVQSGKPVGLYDIARAIDSSLSPSTHIILNLFIAFDAALHTTIFTLGVFFKMIQLILWPFDKLASLFGANNIAAKLFGDYLGVIAALFLLSKLVLMPFVIAFEIWNATVRVARGLAISYRIIMLLLNREWAAATTLMGFNTAATEANTAANAGNSLSAVERTAVLGAMSDGIAATTVVTGEATVATRIWNASLLTLLGTIGLVVAGVAAMYFVANKFHTRVGFGPQIGHTPATPAQIKSQHHYDMTHGKHAKHWWDRLSFIVGGFAGGGNLGTGGNAVVGERGPEIVRLPAGASVHPITSRALAGEGTIVVHVYPQDIYMDGKKVGAALSTAVTDKEARMGGRNV